MRLKKVQYIYVFFSAFLFGSGLVFSGLSNPDNVLEFLDFSGPQWKPNLLFFMIIAALVYAPVHYIVKRRGHSLFQTPYTPPHHKNITMRLLLGAIIFGIGWALSGLCPATAFLRLAGLQSSAFIFFFSMLVGLKLARE
jgi:uncharacterized membrane protein YedE/YeeE